MRTKYKKITFLLLTITFASLLNGCHHSPKEITQEIPADIQETTIEMQEAPKTAKYKIEFIAKWSNDTHPNQYPANAHFSPLVAYSHNNSNIFNMGEIATAGIEEMAEIGATNLLIKEIENIINQGLAYQYTKGSRIDSPGIDNSELTLSQEFPHITFVSMLAPSPDRFVAGSTKLFNNDQWLEKVEIELVTYDAGSDNGTNFQSKNQNTNPKEAISIFNEELQRLGKLVLTKINEETLN